MNADAARMNRLTLRFTDAGLEKVFAEEQAKKSLRPIQEFVLDNRIADFWLLRLKNICDLPRAFLQRHSCFPCSQSFAKEFG